MPLHMRIPKLKGFTNPFRVEYQAVNLDVLDATGLDTITPADLHARGLIGKGALVKVLGGGEISRAVTVHAHGFSKSAEAAITAAGGTVERPAPALGRPSSARQGQSVHQPLTGLPGPRPNLRSTGARQLAEHVQDPGPPEQDPLHA